MESRQGACLHPQDHARSGFEERCLAGGDPLAGADLGPRQGGSARPHAADALSLHELFRPGASARPGAHDRRRAAAADQLLCALRHHEREDR